MAFKDSIKMGDGVRLQVGEVQPKPKPRHAIFETTPDFRRNACSLCNLPVQNPIHLDDEGGD